MELKHKELLRTNSPKLCGQISDVILEVCNYLKGNKIIKKHHKQKILSEKAPLRQASFLLNLIENQGPWAFGALYESCKHNGLVEVADILRPDKAPHRMSSLNGAQIVLAEDEQPLPGSWPTEEHHESVKTEKLNVRKVTKDSSPQMLAKFKTQTDYPGQYYPMWHKCRGNALIINNINFSKCSALKERKGGQLDTLGLKQLFNGLGFCVEDIHEGSAESIRTKIQEEAEKDHSNHDCFVFFILSHGKKGGEVYGTNGETVKIQEMVDTFKNVEDLKGKPKLLFFQACYGENSEKGHSVSSLDCAQQFAALSTADNNEVDTECNASASPDDKDVFEFYSAPDGQMSFRDQEFGTWFAQAVIYVFSEYAHKCDFIELSRKVKTLISKAETSDSYKNVPVLKHVPVQKKLYFFPGQDRS